jgi:MoaA/NifB/PqqE/SkfB family radical SAM enzyme
MGLSWERLKRSLIYRMGGRDLIEELGRLRTEQHDLRLQHDQALGERNAYLLQRDQAIGERNVLANQLYAVRHLSFGEAGIALRELASAIDAVHARSSREFFKAVDVAREHFRSWVVRHGTLEHALQAVKLVNLLAAKHEYLRGAIATTARPVGWMLDPANQCHLGCPGCSNSYSEEFVAKTFNPWPRGLMSGDTFDLFMRRIGMYGFAGHLYNNHEPLLNKDTPGFVRKAADLRVRTFISTNLSYRRIDAQAIVACGLAELMIAADGATQPVYEIYRRGGRLEWVIENVRALVDAKRRLNSPTPLLRWQYLTFAHNAHEVGAARQLARNLGCDSFNVATPYVQVGDEQGLRSVDSSLYEGACFSAATQKLTIDTDLEPYREQIEQALDESAYDRWQSAGGAEAPLASDGTPRCDWLYLATISDAMGRIVPCGNGDYSGRGRFVFADVRHGDNIMNAPAYREARAVVANNSRGEVICARCPARPQPQVGLAALAQYLEDVRSPCFDMEALFNWSRHSPLS